MSDIKIVRRSQDRAIVIADSEQGKTWIKENIFVQDWDVGHSVVAIQADAQEIEDFVNLIHEADLTVEVI